jgi:hypothetical protein
MRSGSIYHRVKHRMSTAAHYNKVITEFTRPGTAFDHATRPFHHWLLPSVVLIREA